ncbi:trimethylamine methyltransferase family protein [Mesorhizobium sp. M0027]
MTPVTLAAALAHQNAEALFGVVHTQLVNPGAPVMYGAFTSNVDMRSGAPAFGTPENTRANLISGQLARRYGLPAEAPTAMPRTRWTWRRPTRQSTPHGAPYWGARISCIMPQAGSKAG